MIKTIPIASDTILAALPAGDPVGILGCGECAAALGTGGTRQVDAWEKLLHGRNPLTFKAVADAPCDQRLLKRFISMLPGFARTRAIIVLTCPAGTQSLASLLSEMPRPPRIIQGLAAKGLVWLSPGGKTTMGCRFCDDCNFDPNRNRLCPTAACPLHKTDGPCQDREAGHLCPHNPGHPCSWVSEGDRTTSPVVQARSKSVPHPAKERPQA